MRAATRRLESTEQELALVEVELEAWHRSSELSQRLAQIPSVGFLAATALAATAARQAANFKNGRQFAAWLGLVPRQRTTGHKPHLGGISKKGNVYIRTLLYTGCSALIANSHRWHRAPTWLIPLLSRPGKVAAIAGANRVARTAWAMIVKGTEFKAERSWERRPMPEVHWRKSKSASPRRTTTEECGSPESA